MFQQQCSHANHLCSEISNIPSHIISFIYFFINYHWVCKKNCHQLLPWYAIKCSPKVFCVNNILSQLLASTILCGGTGGMVGEYRLHHVEPPGEYFFQSFLNVWNHCETTSNSWNIFYTFENFYEWVVVYFGPHHLEAEIKRRYYFISDVLVIGLFISSIGLILKILNSYNIYWLSLRFVGTPVDPLIWRLGVGAFKSGPAIEYHPPYSHCSYPLVLNKQANNQIQINNKTKNNYLI